jgi:hypothetical protein
MGFSFVGAHFLPALIFAHLARAAAAILALAAFDRVLFLPPPLIPPLAEAEVAPPPKPLMSLSSRSSSSASLRSLATKVLKSMIDFPFQAGILPWPDRKYEADPLEGRGLFFFGLAVSSSMSHNQERMNKLGSFFAAIWADWFTRMSGPLTVPFTFAALYLDSKYAKTSFATLAIAAGLTTCYRVWVKEYDRAELEAEKNTAAPHMDIVLENIVTRGRIGLGMTDLFLNVRLVLTEPRELSISDFGLDIFDNVSSCTFTATEDTDDWELTQVTGEYNRRSIMPIVKTLATRGDPVRGWVHFEIAGIGESVFNRCNLTFKVNARHGTCYLHIAGATVIAAKQGLAMMRRI